MSASTRALILLAKKPSPELPSQVAAGAEPRVEYLELARSLGAEVLDHHAVEASTSPVVCWLTRRFGPNWGLAWLGFERRKEFDFLYATGEDVGIPLAILLRASRCAGKLTVVMHLAGTPRRRLILRYLGSRPYRHLICLNTAQFRILTREIGLSPAQVIKLHNWVDHRFFAPAPEAAAAGEYILSVGMESRDYETLSAVARQVDYPFRIVASGWSPGSGFTAVPEVTDQENVTILRGASWRELRELYARARFVVVPLKVADNAAGVTAILEAMAMGKAVIVSASPGILDYVEENVSGRVVPVGDSQALREAITDLWNDPRRASALGARNRGWIEEHVNTDSYVAAVNQLLCRGNQEVSCH